MNHMTIHILVVQFSKKAQNFLVVGPGALCTAAENQEHYEAAADDTVTKLHFSCQGSPAAFQLGYADALYLQTKCLF